MRDILFIHFNKASNPDRVLYPSDIKRAINEDYVSECKPYINLESFDELEAKNTELENKLEIACEALEFYANYENWIAADNGQYKYEGIFFISRDSPYLQTENGKKAFEALSKIKSEGL